MESGSWAQLYSSLRRHQSRSDAFYAEDCEGEEEQSPEFMCPFCAEDFDIVGLCCHIDEEHEVEAMNGVCPICVKKVGSDLIHHMTIQHGNILKVQRRRRLRRGVSNLSFSMLRRELRDANLQSLSAPPSHSEPDSLLASFINSPPNAVADDEEHSNVLQPLSSIDPSSMAESSVDVGKQSLLSDEDMVEHARRCEFVQELMLSTFLDDNL